MSKNTTDELREQILDILRWPYNKAPVRLTQSEAMRQQRADEILALISNREKLLLDRAEKAADEVIDQFSVHVPKGRPKGTVAHRVMKKRMTKRLTTLRKELDGEPTE